MLKDEQPPRPRRIATAITLFLIVLLLLPLAAQAQPRSAATLNSVGSQSHLLNNDDEPVTLPDPLEQANRPLRVVMELSDAPATQVFADAQTRGQADQAVSATQAQVARIEQAQQRLLASLRSLNATVLYRTQRVYNGIAVQVDAGDLRAVAGLPGVKAIHPLIASRRTNSTSVPFIGAPELWERAGSPLTGQGMRIGIIDSGIDYIHTGFGGSGLQADYTRNVTNTIGEAPALFPTAKVVGGFDFVGDPFRADSTNPANLTPAPDPDPMDCDGHGTHVAGTAAGNGVNADGSTYTGPYNASINFSNLRIGPGVAPQASLYALKVFGCEGTSDIIVPAIEFSVDPNRDGNFTDRLDVINMSLGNSAGPQYDVQATASNNAAAAGVMVVTSAGNDSDAYYVSGSPGNADRALSTAASVDNGLTFLGVRVNSPSGIAGTYQAAAAAFGPQLTTAGITNTVAYAAPANGCTALTNGADISGKIALIDRGVCTFVEKVKNAQNAGAVAVLIANNRPGDPSTPGGNDPSITIPSVMISQSDAAKIKANIPTPGVQVSLSSAITFPRPDLADTLASFSSRGPQIGGTGLKPDISAPGQSIVSVGARTGNEGSNLSGTSMASPHMAGSMALLRQLHPTWTVEELKALAMNTAVNDIRTTPATTAQIFSPTRVGAGRVDLQGASAGQVLAYNADGMGRVSVSFGALEITQVTTQTKTVKVVNKGSSSATYDLAYEPVSLISGVSYALSPPSVTIPAGGETSVNVTMVANRAQMRHTNDPSLALVQGGETVHWLSEASGYLSMRPAGAATSLFSARLNGSSEVPPVRTNVTASAVMTYTAATNTLNYRINFTGVITPAAPGGHIHIAAAGANGPVVFNLIDPGDFGKPLGPTNPLSGTITIAATTTPPLTVEQIVTALKSGGLYFNIHTAANPAGEIRGQILPADRAALRLPLFTAARPASAMDAVQTTLNFTGRLQGTQPISLTGRPVQTGSNLPVDEVSLVTAFEWQLNSLPITDPTVSKRADLRYVGATSNIRATATVTNPTGTISDTTVYFGLVTFEDFSSPHQVQFNIFIDTNRDGTDDFLLFDLNAGTANGLPINGAFVSVLKNLTNNEQTIQDYLNGVPASFANTVPFNTNVLVLPVKAADLGLTSSNARFNYRIVTYSTDRGEFSSDTRLYGAPIDTTPTLTYDAANPGLNLANPELEKTPAYLDLPATVIQVKYNRAAYVAAKSQGLLLLHHHNASGNRAEVIPITSGALLYGPIIRK